VLFSCSIRDNIRLGNPDVKDEEIIKAAQDANAHNFISALPKVGEYTTLFQHCQRLVNTQLYFSTAKGW
jgi:ABC-type multidrug transport system fused ATPase/permease subunit